MSLHQQYNQAFHGATVTGIQPVIFRFILDRVFFKCDDAIRNQGLSVETNRIASNFSNSETQDALNLVVVKVPFRSGLADGFADDIGNVDYVATGNYSGQNIVHEFGHAFNLFHTQRGNGVEGDECDDTWQITSAKATFRPTDASAVIRVNNYTDYCQDSAPSFDLDRDGNREGLCELIPGLLENTHYCCDSRFRNNNCMSYGRAAQNQTESCMTPCQMRRVVNDILTNKCDLIEAVDPVCPPPAAVILALPTENLNIASCDYRFILDASMNVEEHRYRIEEETSSGYILAFESDWEVGIPDEYTVGFGSRSVNKLVDILVPGLKEGLTYRLTLEVINDCGASDTQSVVFSGEGCHNPVTAAASTIWIETVFPNPVFQQATVGFTVPEVQSGETIKVVAAGVDAGSGRVVLRPVKEFPASLASGCHEYVFPEKYFLPGTNYLFFQIGDKASSVKIIK